MISYSNLLQMLDEKGINRTALGNELGISSRTIAEIGRGEKIADHVLSKIAAYLGCKAEELYSTFRGLSEWEHEKSCLIDMCLDGQDAFRKMMSGSGLSDR